MRMPATFSPPRPFAIRRMQARSGPEAALELVRIEFERARHERELARLRLRAGTALSALDVIERRSRALLDQLASRGTDRELP